MRCGHFRPTPYALVQVIMYKCYNSTRLPVTKLALVKPLLFQ